MNLHCSVVKHNLLLSTTCKENVARITLLLDLKRFASQAAKQKETKHKAKLHIVEVIMTNSQKYSVRKRGEKWQKSAKRSNCFSPGSLKS